MRNKLIYGKNAFWDYIVTNLQKISGDGGGVNISLRRGLSYLEKRGMVVCYLHIHVYQLIMILIH